MLLAFLLTYGNHASGSSLSQIHQLHTGWEFSMYGTNEWLSAQVPGTVHQDLIAHDKLPDPFYGMNEQKIQWVEKEDWLYRTSFVLTEEQLHHEGVYLVFEGLDTYADVFLNGSLLLKADNMFVGYRVPVKSVLRKGENKLVVRFRSPIREAMPQWESNGFDYPADNDHYPQKLSIFTRKAPYSYGWDWGIRMVTCGIWRPVYLQFADRAVVEDYFVHQQSVSAERAEVDNRLEINNISNHTQQAVVRVTYSYTGEPDKNVEQTVELQPGLNHISLPVTVEQPHLWMPNGWGEPALYTFEASVSVDGQVVSLKSHQIGLRSIRVVQEEDKDGQSFYFEVNGVPMFAKGTNLIPSDALLPRVTRQRYSRLLEDVQSSNMNMVRVWGGGIYEDDAFFEEADRRGILVWQDFMVACANIYLTSEMAEEFTQEAICNLKRLHHHASLALLCGNNEMESGVINWGSRDNQLVRDDYTRLYGHLLPELCETYAPDTYYWPSSPSSGGGFDDPDNPAKGDTHYWEVWHGGVPFTTYRQKRFRFCSEYGFESFPSMKTIRTFAREEDLNCFSRVMENHQKCRGGNGKILRYLADNYLYPATFENLVYASQLLQADAIKYGVEHFRRQRGYCMGSTYWQFNDCWPVASWSSVDCFGRYKALHYAARKFYAPVAMGLFLENGALTVNIANETRAGFRGHIHLAMCRGNLTVLDGLRRDVEVEALSSRDVLTYRVDSRDPYDTFLYADLYDEQGRFLMRQVELLVPAKHFQWRKPAFDVRISPVPGGAEISVQADVFAKGVFLDFRDFDCVLSDNFFALTTPAPYRVTVQTSRSVEELEQNLTIKSVYDIR